MTDPRQETIEANQAAVAFGTTVKQFLALDIGRYLEGRARQMREDALIEMEKIVMAGTAASTQEQTFLDSRMTEVRDELRTPTLILAWINEALQNAESSAESLRQLSAQSKDF